MLGVPDEMMIFHELVGIFVEDSGKDFLWLLVEHKGAGIGCVLDNIRTSQHLFSGALVDGYFDSDIFGWGWILHQLLRSEGPRSLLLYWICLFNAAICGE